MAPNPLNKSALFNSLEPVQIISKTDYDVRPRSQVGHSQHQHKSQIVWRNVIIFVYLHIAGIYGLYLMFTAAQWNTFIFAFYYGIFSGFGITCGAHRLWCHRSYKAKLPLRILLAIFQTIALQNDIYEWVRDHRVHHKFTDTNADPHNSTRGFFFSHMGWLMVKKHKDVFIKGKTVDMSDVEADPVVRFQRKYYKILAPLLSFAVPILICRYFFNDSWAASWYVAAVCRYMLSLHATWLVNSAAHIWGSKPFDKNISPTENKVVSYVTSGEGWHNYHHVFPWDYKAAELGNYSLNLSTAFIDVMAKIGWAYDLKMVSVDMIAKRAKRTGDGSIKYDNVECQEKNEHHTGNHIWGWDDKDMTQYDREMVEIHNPTKNQ